MSKDLSNYQYDSYLADKGKTSRSARQELASRKKDRKYAHDADGVGYHFGLGDDIVKIESKDHLRKELNRRGLMLEVDVKKNLK